MQDGQVDRCAGIVLARLASVLIKTRLERTTMTTLILGLIVFLGAHSVAIVAPAWRDGMHARLGEGPWKGLYSLVSAFGFVLIIIGYGLARQQPVVIYTPPLWLRHLSLLLLVPVFPLLLAPYLPGRVKSAAKHPMLVTAAYVPLNPIKAKLGHPMLAGVKLWALAHLLANGNLADVLLFGGFLAWAVADRISMRHRQQRAVPGAKASPLNDAIVVLGGLALYALFLFKAHAWLFGVSPLG
jgi:uncharacterized membrane protein